MVLLPGKQKVAVLCGCCWREMVAVWDRFPFVHGTGPSAPNSPLNTL